MGRRELPPASTLSRTPALGACAAGRQPHGKAGIGGNEHFHQLAPLGLELPQLPVHDLQPRQGQEVNADFERQAGLVQLPPDVAVERADSLKLTSGAAS